MNWTYILSLILFSTGLYIALSRRNAIVILMGIELMFNAAAINFLVSETEPGEGQTMILFILGIAAAEAATGMAIILNLFERFSSIDTRDTTLLK
jgi:NADH:ubiquinone oxidoreductase subunit K